MGWGGLGPVYNIMYCSIIYYGIMVLWLLAPHGAQAIIVFSHYSTLSLYSLLSTLYSTLYLFQIFSSNLSNIIGYICSIIVDEKVRAAYGRPPSRSCGGLGALRPPLPPPPQKNLKKKKIQDGRHGPKMA